MANPNDNLKRLYENGLKHFTLPDFETFSRDMKDEAKRRRFYTNMQTAYSLPDFDTFSKDIGAVEAAPAKPAAQPQPQRVQPQQPTSTTVKPVTDTTAARASVRPTVQTATQPQQPKGWKPSPQQQAAFDMQVSEAQQGLRRQAEAGRQRMEAIRKGSKPTSFMGEREFNPQTGEIDKSYYTTTGQQVTTPLEKSQIDTAARTLWENSTEAGRRSKEARLKREADRKDEAFSTQLSAIWQRHPEKGLNAAERAWSAAEARQRSARERNAARTYSGDPLINGGREMHTVNASINRHADEVSHMTNFDLDRLMQDSWNNLGQKGQQAIIDDCYQLLRRRNPGADEIELYNQARVLARQQSNLRLYNLAVEKNAPKGNLDYLMRKIGDMNLLINIDRGMAVSDAGTTGDMAAYEEANERYRQDGHKILDVAGMVGGFALDPFTYIAGGFGSLGTKAALWGGGKLLAGRGASAAVRNAATRQFASTLTGRIAGGIAGGAANFGVFEAGKELESQFAHGGHITGRDESGRYINEGYSAEAVGEQALHGLAMGGAIGWLGPLTGNVSDKLVRATASTAGKVAGRAGVYTGATVLEGTIFSVPEWIEGERDAMDVWTDNMAMMAGFKAKHVLKSAGGVIGDLKASFESPANGRKNRMDFESRLRRRMDAPSDGGIALTKDERSELERLGYGDLRELVEDHEDFVEGSKESLTDPKADKIVSRLTDMVYDTRVSEAARAKMYYYATGHRLSCSPIMRGELIEDGKGGYIVESQGANGVITSRGFKSRKEADLELERINRQAELNNIEFGERFMQITELDNRLQEACRKVAIANQWDPVEIYKICEQARRDNVRGENKELDEAKQAILRKVTEELGDFEEFAITDGIREGINEKYGVDIDKAIRKDGRRRTAEEQAAINEYIKALTPKRYSEVTDVEAEDITDQGILTDLSGEALNTVEDAPEDGNGPRGPEGADEDPGGGWVIPHDQAPIGRAVMKYQDRPVEVIRGRVMMMEDGTMVDNAKSDKTIIIRDVETGEIEMVSPEAILTYEDIPAEESAGVSFGEPAEETNGEAPVEGITEREAPAEGVEPESKYGQGQINIKNSDGTITRGWLTGFLNEEGKHEYVIEGNNHDAFYATEEELDNMIAEYYPYEPEPAPAEEDLSGEALNTVEETEDYKNGYKTSQQNSVGMSDEELAEMIGRLTDEDAGLNNYGHGVLAAALEEQARRAQESQQGEMTPEEAVIHGGVSGVGEGLSESMRIERERIGNEWLDDNRVIEALRTYGDGAGSIEELIERAKADSDDERTQRRLDTLLEFESTRKRLEGLISPSMTDETTGTAVSEGEKGAETAVSVGNEQETAGVADTPQAPTALERIPLDEAGEPMFERAENPEYGWDALVEFNDGDVEGAREIAEMMMEAKRKELEKLQKQKPKGTTPMQIKKSRDEIVAARNAVEEEYSRWQQIAEVDKARQQAAQAEQEAEARRIAEEEARQAAEAQRIADEQAAEERRIAAEKAEAERIEKEEREKEEQKEREALEGIPEWHLDRPEDARRRGARRFGGQMFRRQEPVRGVVGKEKEVKFSNNDIQKGRVAVIEASELQPSHLQGERNPMFFIEEAQPKSRTENVSIDAARRMAENMRLNEITKGETAYTGAPTVNARGEVIQGNSRSDALRYLWENSLPEQQAAYRQHIIDNAEDFGVDPEAVKGMKQPVLVNMLDVDDVEAIRLGQMTTQDTESGGIERIKPKNVAAMLGEDMRTFANRLLASKDEEASFSQLVDMNGADVLKWMNQKRNVGRKQVQVINDTQYQSAFDSRGNLTAEAKNDLQKILYQAIFKGGTPQLEEMFYGLPAKAQRALLGTAFRDMDSPREGQMLEEIQSSVMAYGQLIARPDFERATKLDDVLRAVEAFKMETALDDRFEQYSPSDNFSNFALHLAAMYKASEVTQKTLTTTFNEMYDLAQGRKAASLFEDGDDTKYPLEEVLKKITGLDYKPAKNGNNRNDSTGGDALALGDQSGEGGERGDGEPSGDGELDAQGEGTAERAGGTPGAREVSGRTGTAEVAIRHDAQGNPIDEEGNLIIEDVKSVDDITDVDFTDPSRSVGLPSLPQNVGEAIGIDGRKTIIKKNVFIKNRDTHPELSPEEGRDILHRALYNPNLVGTTQPIRRPDYKVAVQTGDKNAVVVLDVYAGKDNVEIVGWRKVDERGLEKMKRQAEREGGQFLILTPNEGSAAALSALPSDVSSDRKVNDSASEKQAESSESSDNAIIVEGEGYRIEAKPYVTKKGKEIDTFLVTFDRDFSKEELAGVRAKAKELRGWKDPEGDGWLLRSEKDARAFAEDVAGKSEDEIADEAPLSMADLGKPAAAVPTKPGASSLNSVKKADTSKVADAVISFSDMKNRLFNEEVAKLPEWLRPAVNNSEYSDYPEIGSISPDEYAKWIKEASTPPKGPGISELYEQVKDGTPLSDVQIEHLRSIQRFHALKQAKTWLQRAASRKQPGEYVEYDKDGNRLDEWGNIVDPAEKAAEAATPNQAGGTTAAEKPRKRRWISEEDAAEFDGLHDELRRHFGKNDGMAHEGEAAYGKPRPREMDAEVLRLGTRMTYLMMRGGLRRFSDYCEAMKEELPDIFDEMRPHLKSLYAATQNMEEVIELGWDEEMDDRKAVKAFDVYNFDKTGAKDMIETAQHVVDENASQQQSDQIIHTLKNQRNEQRKKEADETSADTETIIDKAETTASQVESKLEAANSEEDAEGLSRSLDKELEEVNKQLALLGYYEADPVSKDFNEAYGYMRNAERKAVQDAHRLATQLAADLGITIDPKDKVRKAKYGFGSKIARSNVAPAGGEVYITLPLAEGRELSIWLSLDKNEPWRDGGREDRTNEDLMLTGIMYRVENTGKGGMSRYESSNHNTRHTIPYDELLSDIRRLVRTYLPDETVKPATPLTPQPGEDMVDVAKRVAADKEPKAPAVEPQLPIGDLFGGLFDEQPQTPQPTAPVKGKEIDLATKRAIDILRGGGAKSKTKTTTSKPKSNEKTDVQPRAEGTGRRGQQPRPNEPLGEGAKNEDERTDGGGMAQRGGEHPVSDSDRGAGLSGLHKSERGVSARRTPETSKNSRNNHAERGMDYAPKGEKARIDANIAAIELAKKLLSTGAAATPQEMAILRRYSGWGGLGAAFNEGSAWAPNPVNKRLREALTPEEYQAAVMSRNSAYFTPTPIIDAMWDIAKGLGFKGGNIVEGSAGIGNIIGLMPTEISERSNIHAVEIDPTTGGILSLLYPDAQVEVQGFEQTRIANNSVDLAITNVPFVTDLHVKDESGDSDLSKKFRDIHDFCIAKNVRKLREGGIGIFITSSGTLDKSQKLRNWLVSDKEGNADVVGVFRMNNQTFGGTAATSDIIVVRKRVNGRKSANAIDVSTVTPARTATFTDVRGKTKDLPLYVNRYFIEHPEHMGGEMFFGFEQGDTYRPTSIGLFPTRTADQSARMAAWVQHLADMDWSKEQGKAVSEQTSQINEALGEGVKEGSMVTDSEGNLCVARMGRAVPLTLNKNKIKGRTKEECFKDYTEIKSALANVLKYQTEHDDDTGLQPLLDRLNRAYDTFVQRYGNLNKNNNLAWLRNDVDFSSIVALETYSEKGNKDGTKVKTYGKTDIFSRRVVEKESEPTPKNVKDGIIASIYKYGRIDSEYLSTQLGKSQDDVKKEIVESGLGFVDPTTGQMEVSYEYLSGNVREKLRQAREANETAGGAYDANIKALEGVVPMNIPAHLIEFALGSSWIEPQLYERYVKERTGLTVKLTNAGGTWHMETPYWTGEEKNREMGVRSEKLNKLVEGHELIEAALTNKTIRVQKSTRGETETDESATALCAAKVDEIRQDFKDWAREQMQNDPALSMRMEEKYNEKFNNSVPKSIPDEFVPEHFGGAATTVGGRPFKLRPHQAKAVIRATTQPVLLAHEVGTGKTYTLITTAMEMRRLGTARKPMIVVQNATVGQFVASAKALYPNAKVLTLEDKDSGEEGRRNFYSKIRYNDWDMIVVPQSVLEKIPDSDERQAQFIQDKIEEKLLVLEKMKEADPTGNSSMVRSAKNEIKRLEAQLVQLANGEEIQTGKKKKDTKKAAITRQNAEVKAKEMLDRATDDVPDFDSMGIDAILVDEAHEYKHLGFATAMQRGVKGVDPSYSKKSQGVFLKTQAVLEKTGGKNVVFATGTPISNTAAEIWTFMRYLIPADVMKEYDIYYFDDFVRNFGNIQQMFEFKTNGKFEEVNRFAGYVNLPELVRIWSTVADTVLTREAGGVSDKIPQMEGGKAQDIYLPQTRALRSIMKFVKEELKRYEDMSGKEKKVNRHIPIVMYGIAKASAVDARLVQRDADDDPNSKTNEAVRQTLRSLEETKDYKGTVAIFADNYQKKNKETEAVEFNLYEDIRKKLIAAGVPEEQVVVMKSGMTVKKKLEIFDRVNAGEVRVVMGSTFTLGTGVNIQERLHTLIHLDAPNRPMDYTQRNGRILRQGNLHNTWGLPVRVLRFGVEDSLDVTAYQRLKTKGAIADSIMNGKQLMANSMENRSLEEDQDLFGDITAQLSGSEYAMLKNQIEKEVRKLRAAEKNWKADQAYIHNRKRQITGQNREAEKRIADDKSYLEKVEAATIGDITVGKRSFPSVETMEDFFTEQNKKKAALQEEVRTSGYSSRPATSDITVSVGGFDFKIHTEISRETKQGQQGDLFYSAPAKMTYSCSELGIDAIPVRGNAIKNAVLDIMENVVSGKDFRERIENAKSYIERNNAELESISRRDGLPFKDADTLVKAEEKLAEYEELMKAEMAAKEAKYAEMDKDVEAASNVELTEEDSEETANEPVLEYSAENVNFVSSYETKDGKTVRYTSENPEAYGGLFDFDFSKERETVPGGKDRTSDSGTGEAAIQRQGDNLLVGRDSGLNEKSGEFSVVERVFTENGSFGFTSGERIESADDVAFIFSALEDSAKEHSFMVYVKEGRPTVVELGMGTFTATMVDIPTASLAYNRIRPDQVYFVHNHPSGNLQCSVQDVQMLRKIEEMCDLPVSGVIINLKTGKYGTFDTSGGTGEGRKRVPQSESRLVVHTLDKQIFAPDYDPMAQPLVRGPKDVAQFLNSHRMGDRSKVSFLILSRAGRIVGNIHTPFTEITTNAKEVARYISEHVIQFGGESAILYGDFPMTSSSGKVYRQLKELLSQVGGSALLDVVRVEGNHTKSANDEGLLYEPGNEYGASPKGDIRSRESGVSSLNGDKKADAGKETDARGVSGMALNTVEAKRERAERLAKKFNTPIEVVDDGSKLPERFQKKRGWFDPAMGRVVVVAGNHRDVEDVAETVFHEVVAHKGLREMLGDENYDAFCDEVYDHLKDDLKEEVDRETTRRFEREPEKGYEHHRRVAVDELFGRLAEKGFEDFTKAERGIWAKLKAKVLEAINKFLGSLKLPKWVRLGDNELRYMLWRSHEKLRTKGDYVDMARDAVKREELGLGVTDVVGRKSPKRERIEKLRRSEPIVISGDEISRGETLKEFKKNALEYGKRLQGTYINKDTGSSIQLQRGRRNGGVNELLQHDLNEDNNAQLQSVAALPQIIEEGIYIDSEPNRDTDKNPDVAEYQHYVCGLRINDEDYTVHSIVAVDKRGDRYYDHKLSHIEKGRLLDFIEAKQPTERILATTPGTEPTIRSERKVKELIKLLQVNDAEIDFRFREGETGDIWKDGSLGLEERMTAARVRLSERNRDDAQLRTDAMRAIGGNLTSLRRAMAAQRRYDRSTVKRVADLARVLMQSGYLSGMTSGEVQRLVSAVKNSTGASDMTGSVQKIMDIMVGNQLRNGEEALHRLLAIRGSKVDAHGVKVQGALDVEGQRIMKEMKDAMSLGRDYIANGIADVQERIGDPGLSEAEQENAFIRHTGLSMALDYVENIHESKAEEKSIRDGLKTAKEERDAGRMTADAYKQFAEVTEDAIRKNKIERAEAYFNLVERLSEILRGSIERAKAFHEAEKARISEIHHHANSDMEGRPHYEHGKKKSRMDKLSNLLAGSILSPLATFEQYMRLFGGKSIDGRGYLFEDFVVGMQKCRDQEWLDLQRVEGVLNQKGSETLGRKDVKWTDLHTLTRKTAGTVEWWDGGEMREHAVTQGNLMYVYMADKMTDGRVKLRSMGIDEAKMEEITKALDPTLRELADWIQDEFLPEFREEINEVHMRMFGAPMAEIDNYFPLKVLGNAREHIIRKTKCSRLVKRSVHF